MIEGERQNSPSVDVIVIDDEESIREGCRQTLEEEGYQALVASDGLQGLRLVEETVPPVVLLDLKLPGMGGLEVLQRIHALHLSTVPIIITGYGTVQSAVDSMKLGAFDILTKPFDMEQLIDVVTRGLGKHRATVQGWAVPVAVKAERPEPARASSESDLLLKGLTLMEECSSMGLDRFTFEGMLRSLEREAFYHSERLGRIEEKQKFMTTMVREIRLVDSIIDEHLYKKSALIQILLDLQERQRWLPHHCLVWIGRRLNVPVSRIYEIATFYEAFSLEPQGAHRIQVCLGTACHVRGADSLLAMISSHLGIAPGQTDGDRLFTLETVNCLGCCALGPVMRIDDRYFSDPSYRELKAILKSYEQGEVGHE